MSSVDHVKYTTGYILAALEDDLRRYPFEAEVYDSEYLKKMCRLAAENSSIWPLDKTSRWLGFIQAMMVVYGRGNVIMYRESTRQLFHDAYKRDGIPIPESVDVI